MNELKQELGCLAAIATILLVVLGALKILNMYAAVKILSP